jgi:hypothetical protein
LLCGNSRARKSTISALVGMPALLSRVDLATK